MSRAQEIMKKTHVENMTKMKSTKVSSKVNCVMRTASESANALISFSEAYKEEIRNDTSMIQQIEDNNILEDFTLGSKASHGR